MAMRFESATQAWWISKPWPLRYQHRFVPVTSRSHENTYCFLAYRRSAYLASPRRSPLVGRKRWPRSDRETVRTHRRKHSPTRAFHV